MVCFTGKNEVEFGHLTQCRCQICKPCLTAWLSTQVNDGKTLIECANPYCRQEADITDLQQFLSPEDYNRYFHTLRRLDAVVPLIWRIEDLEISITRNQTVQIGWIIITNIVQMLLLFLYLIFIGLKYVFFR